MPASVSVGPASDSYQPEIRKSGVLQDVDRKALSLSRQLIRGSPQGALATIEAGRQWPSASLVTIATELDGCPLILISALSAHTRALRENPHCGLLLTQSGKGDPLAHPRISVQAQARFLDRASKAGISARRRFLNRHHKASLYADFEDFSFVRLEPDHASLNGGFGKAYELQAEHLTLPLTAISGFDAAEQSALEHMNTDHAAAVSDYATGLARAKPGHWLLTGIDPDGLDLLKGGEVRRIDFEQSLVSPEQIHPTLVALAKQARQT